MVKKERRGRMIACIGMMVMLMSVVPASAATKKPTSNPVPVCVHDIFKGNTTVTTRGVIRTEDQFLYLEEIGNMQRKVYQRYNVELYRCALCSYAFERKIPTQVVKSEWYKNPLKK